MDWMPVRLTSGAPRMAMDTKTPAGFFFFHIMTRRPQTGRELIIETTRTGLG